ncbi:MAG TPA: hypothetical protein VFS08_10795 [Gemmatimonadaceae bacterium]|nr:hypothetical protein [Gemmatimonadaceae bacterium]
MYRTCLFCHADLGANETVERFPVGRRLAFDAARGRLWVVCRRCERWNLSPLEERWEAIEACERLYRDARRRVSTEQIGLAKLPEGLELVRIGQPQRPEFAAWRYGDQFGRRRVRYLTRATLGIGALGALAAGGMAAGMAIGGFGYLFVQLGQRIVQGDPKAVIARVAAPGGDDVTVRRKHLRHVQLAREGADAWSLGLPAGKKRIVRLTGDDAMRAAGLILPSLNQAGGAERTVREAVSLLEAERDPTRYFASAVQRRTGAQKVAELPAPVRLALEMASHEESERRAMEGELAQLAAAWQAAEEIAAISDDLLLPRGITERLASIRRTLGSG